MLFARPRHWLGAGLIGTASAEFRAQNHVNPGKTCHNRVDLGGYEIRVISIWRFQLQRGDCEAGHLAGSVICTDSTAEPGRRTGPDDNNLWVQFGPLSLTSGYTSSPQFADRH